MSNENRLQVSLQVRNGNLNYQSQPTAFLSNMAGTSGPTPGDLSVTPAGVDVSFAQLAAMGGLCWLQNKSQSAWVEWGIMDHSTNHFYSVGEILPGEFHAIRLSRYLGQEFGTGSTTVPLASNETFHLRSHGGSAKVIVHAFDP